MSATLRKWKQRDFGEKCDSQLNYTITGHEIKAADENEARNKAEVVCLTEAGEGLSVLYLVPAAEGKLGAEGIAKRLQRKVPCPVIQLVRSTDDVAVVRLNKLKVSQKIIVATDIVEVGANLNIDVVVYLGIKRTYRCFDGHVRMETIRINQASWTQRRGRVGRQKPVDRFERKKIFDLRLFEAVMYVNVCQRRQNIGLFAAAMYVNVLGAML
uniref:Helicase C-terminal domain-containing protein n=1 Tax=Haemonchus contortus TaxID=6289 RepID=A0A7I5E962_HAECO